VAHGALRRAVISLPNDFEARWYQKRYMGYFDAGGKRACWVVHRRGGKDLTALHQTVKMMMRRPGVYWHIFPTQTQGRKALWEGFRRDGKRIMENVFPRAIRKSPREWLPNAEMVIELVNGSVWRLMGSDSMEVVGAGPVGVVLSEYSLAKPRTWDLIRPMLRENDGWASFVFTPRGKNHGWKLYEMARKNPAWFCELRSLRDTKAYDPEATMAEERAEGMPEDLIRQEYLCDWNAANVGAVFGDLVEALDSRGGIGEFTHDFGEVQTAWDLGMSDATGIWFFVATPRGLDVIDHYEANNKPLSHYLDELERRNYRYKKHWLPHDARARTLATGTSVQEQFEQRVGRGLVEIGPSLSLADGIQAGRWLLQQESLRVHSRCAAGIDALKAYRYTWDDDSKTFSRKPLHDWSSHTADAWRGLAVVAKVALSMLPKPAAPKPPNVRDADSFVLEELWETAQRPSGRLD
jgi:hypothetical protein